MTTTRAVLAGVWTQAICRKLLFVGWMFASSWVVNASNESLQSLQLLGAITDNRGGVALVKNTQTGVVKAFRLGHDIFGTGNLAVVGRNEIIINLPSGERAQLTNKLGGARVLARGKVKDEGDTYSEEGFQRVGNKIDVDASYRDRMVNQELQNILMQATAEPVMQGGEISGFKVYQFDNQSIFYKLGMKEGDVVKEINGVPLNNVAKTIQFLNGLKGEAKVNVQIERDGQAMNLDLNVK